MDGLLPTFPASLLIFMRLSAFFVTVPLFSYRTIPTIFKIGLAAMLSFFVYYSIDIPIVELNYEYILLIIKEALTGLVLGFIAYIMLSAIQIAGGFIDFQMGFAIANVIDPQTGAQSPITGQYLYMFSLLFLLAINGHHLLIEGIFYSYQVIPLDQLFIHIADSQFIIYIGKVFSMMFMSAFQMAIPIVASLFLVDVALGIVARTVPQMNVFVVGFPIKIATSFVVLLLTFTILFNAVEKLFEYTLIVMRDVMSLLGGIG